MVERFHHKYQNIVFSVFRESKTQRLIFVSVGQEKIKIRMFSYAFYKEAVLRYKLWVMLDIKGPYISWT